MAILAKFPVSPEAPLLGELSSASETERLYNGKPSKQKTAARAVAVQQLGECDHCAACARQSSIAAKTASLVMVLPVTASTPAVLPASFRLAVRLSAAASSDNFSNIFNDFTRVNAFCDSFFCSS